MKISMESNNILSEKEIKDNIKYDIEENPFLVTNKCTNCYYYINNLL